MSLPETKGRYLARAVQCWFIEAKSNNYQVAITCEVTDGDYGGERIAWTGTFAPGKATEIAMKALKEAFGWQGDDLSELADLDSEGCARLLPNVVEIVCDMEEYEGEYRLKVKWANPPGGGKFGTPLSGDKLKAFAAQMRGTIRGASGSQRSTQTKPPARKPAAHPNAPGNGGPDDDIPF